MSSYAIIASGSKQYRVEPKTVIEVEKLEIPENQKEISLNQVLFLRQGDNIRVGAPFIQGAKVLCDYLGDFRGPKVISFKFRRRKASRKKHGHRQDLTRLQVKEIIAAK